MRVHASALTRRRDYSGPRDIDNHEDKKEEFTKLIVENNKLRDMKIEKPLSNFD